MNHCPYTHREHILPKGTSVWISVACSFEKQNCSRGFFMLKEGHELPFSGHGWRAEIFQLFEAFFLKRVQWMMAKYWWWCLRIVIMITGACSSSSSSSSVLFISTSSPWSRDQSQEHKTQLSVTPRVVIPPSSKFSYLMTVMMILNCAAAANVMTLHEKKCD